MSRWFLFAAPNSNDKLNLENVRYLWPRTSPFSVSQEIVSMRDLYGMPSRMNGVDNPREWIQYGIPSMQIKANEREEFKWCDRMLNARRNHISARSIGSIRFDMVLFRRISSNHSDTLLTSRHCFQFFSLFGRARKTREANRRRWPSRTWQQRDGVVESFIFHLFFPFRPTNGS